MDISSSSSSNRNGLNGGASSAGGGGGGGGNAIGLAAHYHRPGGAVGNSTDGVVSTEMSTVSQSFLYYQQHHHREHAQQQQQSTALATKATIQEHHPSTTYPRHHVHAPPPAAAAGDVATAAAAEKKHIRYQPIQYQIEYEKQHFQHQNSSSFAKRMDKRSASNNDEVTVSLISSAQPPPPPTIVTIGQSGGGIAAVSSASKMSQQHQRQLMHPAIMRSDTPSVIERGGGGGGGVSSVVIADPNGGASGEGMGMEQEEQEEEEEDANNVGSEVGNSQTGSTTKRNRSKHRPLFRRLFHYVRNTLIGQKAKGDADECEVYELPPRYRPESVSSLCRVTRFSEEEVKRLYRGFKAECPSGVIREDTFKIIYSQFFSARANTGNYAHFVFNTLDQDNSGIINFEDFLQTLSILSRGTVEEKLTWTFALYDINGDGCVTREEMTDIVTAIYDMVDRPGLAGGSSTDLVPQGGISTIAARMDGDRIKQKVDQIFQKMDTNQDGVVTLDEFISCCRNDEVITNSMIVFDTIVL